MYIYELKNWTDFTYNHDEILPVLSSVRLAQGRLMGKMNNIGFPIDETILTTMTLDVVKSSEIEGIKLNVEQVRSSVARHLGIDYEKTVRVDKNIDGIVEIMLDATQNYIKPLTQKRILGWQAALFPTGYSGINKIETGKYRTGEVDVVSGMMGQEKIHFSAIPPQDVNKEMKSFLKWINSDKKTDGLIKSAMAHFWFVTIHPFEDGNGRIARAITDMMLARDEKTETRFYSMSNQLQKERKEYYDILEQNQKGDSNITDWIKWFLRCLNDAINDSDQIMQNVITKSKFWAAHRETALNDRQVKVLKKLLNDFDGNLTSSKWSKLAKTSNDTALRDINDLVSKDILKKNSGGGRSTSYKLIF